MIIFQGFNTEFELQKACVIVVENLPIANTDKYPKLLNVVSEKIFKQFGQIVPDGVSMPLKDGATLGFCFIQVTFKMFEKGIYFS